MDTSGVQTQTQQMIFISEAPEEDPCAEMLFVITDGESGSTSTQHTAMISSLSASVMKVASQEGLSLQSKINCLKPSLQEVVTCKMGLQYAFTYPRQQKAQITETKAQTHITQNTTHKTTPQQKTTRLSYVPCLDNKQGIKEAKHEVQVQVIIPKAHTEHLQPQQDKNNTYNTNHQAPQENTTHITITVQIPPDQTQAAQLQSHDTQESQRMCQTELNMTTRDKTSHKEQKELEQTTKSKSQQKSVLTETRTAEELKKSTFISDGEDVLESDRDEQDEHARDSRDNQNQNDEEKDGDSKKNKVNALFEKNEHKSSTQSLRDDDRSYLSEYDSDLIHFANSSSILSELLNMRCSQFDILILFFEILKLHIKSRRYEQESRIQDRLIQLDKMEQVVSSFKSQGNILMFSGIASGVLAIFSGVSPIFGQLRGDWLLEQLGKAFTSLKKTDADSFFENASKITMAMSEMTKATGQIQTAFHESHRSKFETLKEFYRIESDEDSRKLEDIKEAWKSLENFIYQNLQMAHDTIQQLYR